MIDLSDTTVAKSDQLNAEDLIASNKTIKITNVVKYTESGTVKYLLNYEGDNGRPFKPCLIMRRLMNAAWGLDGSVFIGRLVRLYCDPDVDFGKQKGIGGIRINGLSDIQGKSEFTLTIRKGIKKTFIVDRLEPQQKPPYPADKFTAALPAMQKAIQDGKTPEQVITQCEQRGTLTDEQRAKIRKLADKSNEQEFFNDEGGE